MKAKVTKKAVKANFITVISVGYCAAENLLYYKTPFAYSCGEGGWSCDYYDLGSVCISTGYSPTGTAANYALLRELDKQAAAIVNNNALPYAEKVDQVDAILRQFTHPAEKV